VWNADSLLGNDSDISNYKTAAAKKRLREQACFHSNKGTVFKKDKSGAMSYRTDEVQLF
jgi:hypothetical protein